MNELRTMEWETIKHRGRERIYKIKTYIRDTVTNELISIEFTDKFDNDGFYYMKLLNTEYRFRAHTLLDTIRNIQAGNEKFIEYGNKSHIVDAFKNLGRV